MLKPVTIERRMYVKSGGPSLKFIGDSLGSMPVIKIESVSANYCFVDKTPNHTPIWISYEDSNSTGGALALCCSDTLAEGAIMNAPGLTLFFLDKKLMILKAR